jgi:3-methylcrotonyl-CoA carboxylase alpha subunit
VRLDGHAIEGRLYAEDPARDFAPAPGTMHRYRHGTGEDGFSDRIRWEDGIGETAEISPFYDPMIAKVIAHAPTRAEASLRLARALAATELHQAVLVATLTDDDFLTGQTRTDFIDRHPGLKQAAAPTPEHVHLAAAVAVSVARRRRSDRLTRSVPPGFRLLPGHPDPKIVWSPLGGIGADGSDDREITYRLSAAAGDAELRLTIDGTRHDLFLRDLTVSDPASRDPASSDPEGGTVRVRDGSREWPCRVAVHADGSVWVNDPDGQRGWRPRPRLPERASAGGSGPVADLAGVVVAVKVKPGDHVTAGQHLVVVEAMKMEWPTVANIDGVVEAVHVTEGQYVAAQAVLVTIAEKPASPEPVLQEPS